MVEKLEGGQGEDQVDPKTQKAFKIIDIIAPRPKLTLNLNVNSGLIDRYWKRRESAQNDATSILLYDRDSRAVERELQEDKRLKEQGKLK